MPKPTSVTEALKQRISIREFLPRDVSAETLRAVLDAARWSPSGGNLQPWKVIAVAGQEKDALTNLAFEVLARGAEGEDEGFPIYPANLWEPYRTRRFVLGEAMYDKLDIPRTDKAQRLQRFTRNYQFFGAPVGLFFVIDRRMGHGQWAHLGMFMQSLALVALEHELGSCMQEAWGAIRKSLHGHFALPAEEMVYCGMSLGYPDPGAAVNALRSERAGVEEFATLRGFTDHA
jgi:nitroreductase